jgi:plastocyanin
MQYRHNLLCVTALLLLSFGITIIVEPSVRASQSSPVYAQAGVSVSIVQGASLSSPKPYNPSPLTVKVGTTVTWKNNDNTIHTVSSGLPEAGAVGTLFDSGLLNPGKTYTHTFDKVGTFDYSCTLHPMMHGQVIVKM